MAYVKKISDKQFTLDCINKEFEIVGSPLHFDTFEDLVAYSKEHKQWYTETEFVNKDQYDAWKDYFMQHFYDWKPKRYPKSVVEREFSWFSLNYGLKFGYDPFAKNI